MSNPDFPVIRPEEPEGQNSKSFELSFGQDNIVLSEECRNSISILVEEAKANEQSLKDVKAIVQDVIKPDPMFLDQGRFLECLPDYEGLGVEGGFVPGKPGLHFADPYWGGVMVFPNNPEYVIFDFAIDPGAEYTPYCLGKRDHEGRGYAIANLKESSLKKAVEKAQELIDNGHPEPIPLPVDLDEATQVNLPDGFTGKLKLDPVMDNEGDVVQSGWSCEVFSPQGKSLATIRFADSPIGIMDIADNAEKMKMVVSAARKRSQAVKNDSGLPF